MSTAKKSKTAKKLDLADMKALVIVESPTKAKTIKKYLPSGFIVEASMGHVRDLPQSAADIPAALKKEAWAKIGVNVDDGFEPLYVIPKGKAQKVRELKSHLKKVDIVYLATDEDREGESISWHVLELLKPKVPVKRMVFHEITKSAIQKALQECRDVDMKLVRAQETRRILDRLYGYTLSPLIWKKIAYGLSAGRVQSSGLKMIVERERERMRFKKSQYCSIKAQLEPVKVKTIFESRLLEYCQKRIAIGKDFDSSTGKLATKGKDKVVVLDKKQAEQLQAKLKGKKLEVISIENKESFSHPAPPFITSTLQQEGIRKLYLSARETMRIAQKLYENGLITYMRTDSPSLSKEAIAGARQSVEKLYGTDFLHKEVRVYKSKSKGAQEAHEAIRPSGAEFLHPDETGLTGKEKSLYELIWKRTLASQMAPAKKNNVLVRLQVQVEGEQALFAASGTQILFPGFLRVYVEGKDDPEAALDDKEVILPPLKKGDSLPIKQLEVGEHETKPPARFTEASLVQRLEKEGIGRPSTYASIIGTIQERGYVRKDQGALIPSFTGLAVIQLLENNFQDLVDYSFTSAMENSLDEIAEGNVDWLKYLKKFYLGKKGLKEQVELQDKNIKADESRTIKLENIGDKIEIKVGRYGPYLVSKTPGKKDDSNNASIPESIAPADLTEDNIQELVELSKKGPEPIGVDPETKKNVYCLIGRYGAYVQLGEVDPESKEKPKRASLVPPMTVHNITLQEALKLLALPRTLGNHPDSGKPIQANNGKFGPYVVCDGDFRSLKKTDDPYTITFNRAMEILSEPKVSSRGAQLLKEFGKHPKTQKKIAAYDGKYGVFLKYGTKNVGLPDKLRSASVVEKWKLNDAAKFIDENMKN